MAEAEQVLLEAAKLPLNDGAFWLWINKRQFDRITQASSAPTGHDLNDPGVFAKVVRDAMTTVLLEQENAPDGPTFDRMKLTHPAASDKELKEAVRAAIKLYVDCGRHGSYHSQNRNLIDAVNTAIESAKRENPGFSEETYKRAWHDLAWHMR